MKKVLAAALLCAVSSFAAWDKFPVLQDGKGEGKIGITQSRQGVGDKDLGFYAAIRYVPMANLEIMAINDFWSSYTIGARYQVMPILAAGLDVMLPIPHKVLAFAPSVQFSMDLTPNILLGSNVGLTYYTGGNEYDGEYEEDYNRGMDLDAGIEIDIKMGKSTIWVGFDIRTGLTRSDVDGEPKDGIPLKYENRGLELLPGIGYIASPSDNLSLQTYAIFAFGKDAGHYKYDADADDGKEGIPNTTVGVEFAVKF